MRAANIDANQPLIVDAFRSLGCSVHHTHRVGQGFPDITVGLGGRTYLIEIKDGDKPPSRRRLNDTEAQWHGNWLGHVEIVETVDDVQRLVAEWRQDTWRPIGGLAAKLVKNAMGTS